MHKKLFRFFVIMVFCILLCVSQGCSGSSSSVNNGPQPLPSFEVTDAGGTQLAQADWADGSFVIYAPYDRDRNDSLLEAVDLFAELNPKVHFEQIILFCDTEHFVTPSGWRKVVSEELDTILRKRFGNFNLLTVKNGFGMRSLSLGLADRGRAAAVLHISFYGSQYSILDHLLFHSAHKNLPLESVIAAVKDGGDPRSSHRLFFINNLDQKYRGISLIFHMQRLRKNTDTQLAVLFGPEIPDYEFESLLGNFDLPGASLRAPEDVMEAWRALDRRHYYMGANFMIECRDDGEPIRTVYLDSNSLGEFIHAKE